MVGIPALEARSRPYAVLRLERTRTIWVLGSLESVGLAISSITAWRLLPLPDMRTVRRIGVSILYVLFFCLCCRFARYEYAESQHRVPYGDSHKC